MVLLGGMIAEERALGDNPSKKNLLGSTERIVP